MNAKFEALRPYLPEGSFEAVTAYIEKYKIRLTITRARRSVLGDYRYSQDDKQHRISVNGNLNKFSFLITFLHELAHLEVNAFQPAVRTPHGREWKTVYGRILVEFIGRKVFPEDVEAALFRSIKNPGASTCAEPDLMRVLRKYDANPQNTQLLEELALNQAFIIRGGRKFIKGEKIRKRYRCKEIETGKWFLFNALYEVKSIG